MPEIPDRDCNSLQQPEELSVKYSSLLLVAAVLLSLAAVSTARPGANAVVTTNQGVCDDLQNATPGLYGLCVSFCEAQDCVPDFSLDDPFQNCQVSSPGLLAQYNRRKQADDPSMPCVQEGSACPCWSSDELSQLRHPAPQDTAACLNGASNTRWSILGENATGSYATRVFGDANGSCFISDACDDGSCLGVSRNLQVSPEEGVACQAGASSAAHARNIDCGTP
jgi:hypothetical protein